MSGAAEDPPTQVEAHDEAQAEAKAFRPNTRPAVIAISANVLLAAVCLGVPYYRGHLLAERSIDAFAGFAQCLLGGKAQTSGGLSLPDGERDHFAAQVMSGDASWPERCQPELARIAPEEAVFLWPSVKQAGADLRAVVELFARELETVTAARAEQSDTRVPTRPLLALGKLQAGLTLLARAAGAEDNVDRDAIEFVEEPALVRPTRLPINAGATATLNLRRGASGFEAVAMDRRGISWLRLLDGQLEKRRVARSGLVRAVLRSDDRCVAVWATRPDRCEEREDHCAYRTTGIAYLDHDAQQLPEPHWLGGHPGVRPDRALRFGLGGRVDMLALDSPDGQLEVRRYGLPDPALSAFEGNGETGAGQDASADQSGEEEEPPTRERKPLSPQQRWRLPDEAVPLDALLLPGAPATAVFALPSEGRVRVVEFRYEEPTTLRELALLSGGEAWLHSCVTPAARWLVAGTATQIAVIALDREPQPPLLLDIPETYRSAIARDAEDPQRDGIDVACRPGELALSMRAKDDTLLAAHCGREACTPPKRVAQGVWSHSIALTADASVVAYARKAAPQIRVARLSRDGEVGDATVPAACWDPVGGLCGQPTLLADGKRLLLGARDGSDLLMLESDDGARSFHAMEGLKVGTAIDTSTTAPLEQHRIRKGLD